MDNKVVQIGLMIVGIAGGIVGFRLLGFSFLIVLAALFGCWHLFRKLGVHRQLAAPLTCAAAHGIWFLAGLVLAPLAGIPIKGMLIEIGPDMAILAALAAWIYLSRSKASLYALIAYEGASLAFNGYVMATEILPLGMQLNLAAHMALRLATVVTAAIAVRHHAAFAKTAMTR